MCLYLYDTYLNTELENEMSYKLYTDKSENFECEVSVKNASLKNSIARLVIESTTGPSLIFTGKIEKNKCIIPIKQLNGMLAENSSGKMHLEVIVEDTYFKPWQSAYTVETHTSVKAMVDEQKKPSVKVKTKPILTVGTSVVESKEGINVFAPKREIASICKQFGITNKTYQKRRGDFIHILKEYFKQNPEYINHSKVILYGIENFLK